MSIRKIRFRVNRIPYIFPGWVGDQFQSMQINEPTELWGTILEETDDRYTIELDFDCAADGDQRIKIEWLKVCTEVLDVG